MVGDEKSVGNGAEEAAQHGRENGYPEEAIAGRERLGAPASHGSEDTRRKVTCRIDGEATIVAEASAHAHERQSDEHGDKLVRELGVEFVGDGVNGHDEESRGEELIEEHGPRVAHVVDVVRVRGEYARRLDRVRAVLVALQCVQIDKIDHERRPPRAHALRDHVEEKLVRRHATQ